MLAHLEDFIACYNPANRHERTATWSEGTPDGRWRAYTREELLSRDKASLDVFWLKDSSMTDLDSLLEPDILLEEILETSAQRWRISRRFRRRGEAEAAFRPQPPVGSAIPEIVGAPSGRPIS